MQDPKITEVLEEQYQPERHVSLDDVAEIETSPIWETEAATEGQIDTSDAVQRVLNMLKPSHRDLLWGSLVEGKTHADLAESEGVSRQAVTERLGRAQEAFRAKWEEVMGSEV